MEGVRILFFFILGKNFFSFRLGVAAKSILSTTEQSAVTSFLTEAKMLRFCIVNMF